MPKVGDPLYSIQCCGEWINIHYNVETLCPICNNTFIASEEN